MEWRCQEENKAQIRNPNIEIRNKFKIQKSKSKTKTPMAFCFGHWGFVYLDLFRISDFGFFLHPLHCQNSALIGLPPSPAILNGLPMGSRICVVGSMPRAR